MWGRGKGKKFVVLSKTFYLFFPKRVISSFQIPDLS